MMTSPTAITSVDATPGAPRHTFSGERAATKKRAPARVPGALFTIKRGLRVPCSWRVDASHGAVVEFVDDKSVVDVLVPSKNERAELRAGSTSYVMT